MLGQNVWPVQGKVAVRTRLGCCLASIGSSIESDRVINHTTGITVIMANPTSSEVSGVTILTLATMDIRGLLRSRTKTDTAVFGMTSLAAIDGMNLAGADEGWRAGRMATNTVHRQRSRAAIDRNRAVMAVVVGIEVGSMALDTGAALAAKDSGIPVWPGTAVAVLWIMAGITGSLMDVCDPVASVAADAEGSVSH